ncbi:LamG domain-containing protein [Cellvibrio mixtus]|uniref:LamG domain-containing protein n=1 Tax=Cellvibrio mixtus TaxID=39650 RepID=UPI000AEA8673|nr:LamG domain-containing protein [Cellvibrio mixtus]
MTTMHIRPALLVSGLLLVALLGCGSGSGSKTETNPNTNPGNGNGGEFSYKGNNPAATADITKFQNNVWINIARENRCGGCHVQGKQAPEFSRGDDINLAYAAVIDNGLVSLGNPAQSRLVTKVAAGHNCWLADPVACGDIMATWITAWAGNTGTTANSVVLTPPAEKDVSSSKTYPASAAGFSTTVYPLLTQYCAQCHSESALTRQQPYFASSRVDVAYEAAKTRMRLDNPTASRFVQRLAGDGHNCWSNCSQNAAEMQAAITTFANSITPVTVDPELVISKAVGLGDAFVVSSGGRIDTDIIAKYEFKTGKGSIAYDTSGVDPVANLNLIGNVGWSSAWGLKFRDTGKAQAATGDSRKFYDLLRAAGEYSIEAWVIPDNVVQGDNDNNPARIVTYSGSATTRNFTLGQYEYNYSVMNRTSVSDANGLRELATAANKEILQASLQHVVVSFDPIRGRRIYVNGEFTGDTDPDAGAVLKDWDSSFALAIGNDVSNNRPWAGSIRFLAIHKRAMSAADIKTNFNVGVGAKYLLLFNVSELVGTPLSFIVFDVQQFDDYSYLFSSPFFTNLGEQKVSGEIDLKGLRIGVNGVEAHVGQVFAHLDTKISAAQMVDGRQTLSTLGTIVEMKQGPDQDQFFLTFDQIGTHHYNRTEVVVPPPATPADIPGQPHIGLRNFAEINATLSALTGVSKTNAAVRATYAKVEQQLPTLTNIEGFLAAQQMGITQLAVSYCNALVDDTSLRSSYFSGFNFGANAGSAFNATGRNQIIEPLMKNLLAGDIASGGTLGNKPDPLAIRTELNLLIDRMTACAATGSCSSNRTAITVKATCAAAMGSAIMLLQ